MNAEATQCSTQVSDLPWCRETSVQSQLESIQFIFYYAHMRRREWNDGMAVLVGARPRGEWCVLAKRVVFAGTLCGDAKSKSSS